MTENDEVVELIGAVRLSEDPALGAELAPRLPAASEPRALSVTDLLDPRRAFWRRQRGPAPLAPERELRLELGRAWHRRIGDAMASEGRLEVRLRRGGVAGRIDLLADVPVEIKTGGVRPGAAPPQERAEYVEQLAVYCALLGRREGRLVHVALEESAPPSVGVFRMRFRDPAEIVREVERREADLRRAIGASRATDLPRCRWYGPACEYRAAGLCDCTGDEPAASGSIVAEQEAVDEDPSLASRWAGRFASLEAPSLGPAERFRDGLYPRRSYFRRTVVGPAEAPHARPSGSPMDAYERAVAALERGPAGEVHRLSTGPGTPEEEVLAWEDAACLVRASRARSRLTVDDVKTRFPQYVLELGFRCAAAATPRGRLLVAYETPTPGELPVQVFDLDLEATVGRFAALWGARREAIAAAVARGRPGELAPCPAWMAVDCPYRASCGCAEAAGRSQR